ncbi:transcription/translation regulatory transformer protein RfaH [Atopomonas sediminilitoris]|uniref:transcription/translation regulatory transformer protein RfaH n=1 Tax=Atopomonas sediminilitoris TaxID=2919919 RepID=UPI001F4EE699|nr:transcription/translation regulatory transformer protein RfaH [Atopomonas sediminilitoris]MCJ8168331.1 transcription/translation regulatory transformer protein RfaH [Atopomonas sediminilitoris]
MSAIRWYVLQCKPRQDERALENLQRQGFHCYRPTLCLEKLLRGQRVRQQESLFPGYVFIQLDPSSRWSVLRSTRGVSRVVSFAGAPVPLPIGLVEHWQAREHSQEIPLYRLGDKLRVCDGPFAELEVIFQQARGLDRVVVLLNILNQPQCIELPVTAVKTA